jgi:hypothetical protein
MQKLTLFSVLKIIGFLMFFMFCQQKKEESFIDTISKVSLVSLATSSSKCQISSANNTDYFVSGSVPDGGSTAVERISTQSGNTSLEIYYPTGSSVSLPILVLFQGGNVHSSFYSKYAARLASSGYVVYAGNRCDIFIVQYFLYPAVSLGNKVLELAKTQNTDSSSTLFGRMDISKIGFLGHSLGGVVGLYAMNKICEFPFCSSDYAFLSEVKAGVFYGSGLGGSFSQSKFYIGSNGKGIPTGYIQGSVDGANKPATGLASYTNAIATKAYFSVDGANHYGITDVNNPFGANIESSTGTLSQSTAISKIAESSLIFLDAYIKSDTTALNKIINSTSGITNVTVTGEQ